MLWMEWARWSATVVAGEVLASVAVHHVVVSCAIFLDRSERWVSYTGLAVLELPVVTELITHSPMGPELDSTRTAGVALYNTHTSA